MTELSKGGRVQKPKCPVIVVIGEADDDIPPAKSRKVAEMYGAKVLSYPKMSHVGPLLSTSAEKVAADVLMAVSN
jgi:hypothetical protein